jgi:hypothetical protein
VEQESVVIGYIYNNTFPPQYTFKKKEKRERGWVLKSNECDLTCGAREGGVAQLKRVRGGGCVLKVNKRVWLRIES